MTLPTGVRVLIRPIRPSDRTELSRGIKRLSQETIRRRFLAAKPRLSSSELTYLTEVDNYNHVALVAVELTYPHRILAVARFVRLPEQPDTAEWAIVVGDQYQGMGLGTRMIEMLVDEARERGIDHFSATILGENEAVARLLRHVNARFERDEMHGGVREVVVALAA